MRPNSRQGEPFRNGIQLQDKSIVLHEKHEMSLPAKYDQRNSCGKIALEGPQIEPQVTKQVSC